MLRKLFPNLAEWPVEKWLAAPMVLIMVVAPTAGLLHIALVSAGIIKDKLVAGG